MDTSIRLKLGSVGNAYLDADGRSPGGDETLTQVHELQFERQALLVQNEELARTRDELEARLKHYVDLYEGAPVGLVVVDPDGIVREINRLGRGMLAAGSEGPVGRPLLECVAEESREALRRAMAAPQAPRTGGDVLVAVAAPAAEGRILRAEFQVDPAGSHNLRLALRDVTTQRQAEADLARTREIFELSNRAARIGFWEVDLDRSRMTWSAVTREIHEASADFEPSLTSAIDFHRQGASRDRLRAAIAAAIARGEPYDVELEVTTCRGKERWIRTIGLAEMIDGRCRRLYGTVQDIDARIRAEEARLAQVRTEAASRGKSEFLSRMSHELRTPLNAVLGFAQLLAADREEPPSPRQKPRIAHIERAGMQLLELIDGVLNLSAIDSGQVAVQLEAVEVGPLLDEAFAIVAAESAAAGVAIRHEGRSAGRLTVTADRAGLRQCIVNLLGDAIRFARHDSTVAVTLLDRGSMVLFGIGNDRPDPDRTGPPRQEASVDLSADSDGAERTNAGSGINLSIARRWVEAMHGRLNVDRSVTDGPRFSLEMPRPGVQCEQNTDRPGFQG